MEGTMLFFRQNFHMKFFHFSIVMKTELAFQVILNLIQQNYYESTTFEFPSYQYQIKDWEFKKKGLLKGLRAKN